VVIVPRLASEANMKQTIRITLDIEYDTSSEKSPTHWDFSELLEVNPESVCVINWEKLPPGSYPGNRVKEKDYGI